VRCELRGATLLALGVVRLEGVASLAVRGFDACDGEQRLGVLAGRLLATRRPAAAARTAAFSAAG